MGQLKRGLNGRQLKANQQEKSRRTSIGGKIGRQNTMETEVSRKAGDVRALPDPTDPPTKRKVFAKPTEGRTKTFASMTPEEKAKMVKLYGGK